MRTPLEEYIIAIVQEIVRLDSEDPEAIVPENTPIPDSFVDKNMKRWLGALRMAEVSPPQAAKIISYLATMNDIGEK